MSLRLACVTAHPDDESLGFGGTLALHATDGVEVSLIVATRGERGRYGDGSEPHPGPEELGRIREAELRAAADELGVAHVRFLDYVDGELDRAEPIEAAGRVGAHLRDLRPHVVITFDPFGVYGHPDHVAISQLTVAGVVRAAWPGALAGRDATPHQVEKVYYHAFSDRMKDRFERVFKPLRSTVDGVVRETVTWPDWSVTTVTPADEHWKKVWSAVRCHRTQLAQYGPLAGLGEAEQRALWGPQEYYRVFSLVNGGPDRETDLFQGLR